MVRPSLITCALVFLAAVALPPRAAASIELVSFAAEQNRHDVLLSWRTAREDGNLGYHVLREQAGVRTRVNKQLIGGGPFSSKRAAEGGYSYSLRDTLASSSAPALYWLESVALDGSRTMHGPVAPLLTSTALADEPPAALTGVGAGGYTFFSPAGAGAVRPSAMPVATDEQRARQLEIAADAGLKIHVAREGWYRITRAEMIEAGFDPGPVATKIGLWCGGIEQPLVVDTGKDGRFDLADFVEFYGLGLDTASTAARAYWLRASGSEARFATRPLQSLKAPVFSGSVPFTVQRTDRWFFVSYITGNPAWDGWAGVAIGYAGTEDRDFQPTVVELNVANLDRSSSQNATLSLDLQGITYGRHIVDAWVGSRPVGTAVLNNQEQKTVSFSFPTAWLPDGKVRLNLRSRNGWEDYSGLQSARLTYPVLLRAQDGLFQAALPPQSSITVGGFAPGAIRAIDVTDPLAPEWLDVKTTPDGSGLKASFVTPSGSGDRTVLVVGENRFLGAPEMAPNRPSSWSAQASTLSADMVIVTHGAFTEAARTLEAFRDARGIATTVVDVEDIYDEVSFGIRSAEAIRSFLQSTSSWAGRPRFAILLGDASSDPRNYFDLGLADFVPTKMLTTEYEKTAVDDWFTDFDDDDIADIPIGRIPARTAAEAALMISKITSRATTGSWLDRAVFVADANIGWNFERSVDLAAAYLPPSVSAQKIRRGRGEIGALIPALDAGASLVEYIGHGTIAHWTGSFGASQALAMTNGDRLPVVITMTCLNGYFHDIYQDSLAEAFLKAPNGGASAVWASSSLTYPHTQEMMNNELMRRLFAPGSTVTIGEAMALAKRAMNDRDVRRSWILFGDPSMTVR